ncbi:MAG: hypothetical protein JNM94_08965 [Phycisphaerae bacterium]|nr:hypothetical protein [Phycisphaerae bacterium]
MTTRAAEPRCLGCGYSLLGLANDVACPECGRSGFGVQGVAFGGALCVASMAWRHAVLTAFLWVGALAPLSLWLRGANRISVTFTVTFGTLAVVAVWMLRRCYAPSGPCAGTWIVSDAGVYQYWGRSSIAIAPWPSISDVRCDWRPLAGWRVSLSLVGTQARYMFFVPTRIAAAELIDAITAHRDRSRAQAQVPDHVAAVEGTVADSVFLTPDLAWTCSGCGRQRMSVHAFGPCPGCNAEGVHIDDRHAFGRRTPLSPQRGPITLAVASFVIVPVVTWIVVPLVFRDWNATRTMELWAAATFTVFVGFAVVFGWQRRNATDLCFSAFGPGIVIWGKNDCRCDWVTWAEVTTVDVGHRRGRWRQLLVRSATKRPLGAWFNARDVDIDALAHHLSDRARRSAALRSSTPSA